MVNVDPYNASVSSEPLLTLSSYRRDPDVGRVKFGVLLDVLAPSPSSSSSSSSSSSVVTLSAPSRLIATVDVGGQSGGEMECVGEKQEV
eukprot:CAMPEP_0202834818 /NCGR_PEP_ID=MMETSP1389-20130828/33959_1 /ASSEMBLY_ACC=CAM_ASM_000865 /TAXON_ID=302021 /ORGANISM="Rhodomonas sp., Strain CCMP768" /LENGTH=88 /DNA_ID=CAMNT_0049510127 /DNA_START=39 /DNA_END=305 /DNA_ORIENTATION=+